MRSRWAWALIVVITMLAAAAWLGGTLTPGTRVRYPSSLSGDPEGLLGFRRLLDAEGVTTEILDRPWSDLDRDRCGVLIVATPLQRGVSLDETTGLERYLRSGGAILVVDDAGLPERDPALDTLLFALGLEPRPAPSDLDVRTHKPERPSRIAATRTPAAPGGSGLDRVMLHGDADVTLGGDAIPLMLTSSGHTVAAEARVGAGRAVLVQGPLLANDRLLDGGGLDLAFRLVDGLRGESEVWFDEYHHGVGGLLVSARGLDRTALIWAGIQALVVTLIYGIARGVRFGPVRIRKEATRRSSLEFVHSMASLYRRAGARRHVLAGMLARFAREARARWELEYDGDPVELARQAATHAGVSTTEVERAVAEAHRALGNRSLDERHMTARARDLARAEQEVFGVDR